LDFQTPQIVAQVARNFSLSDQHQEEPNMLVLSRKKNESIVINNDITVTVVEIRDDKVRLGIVTPKEVPVHRQEVYEAIHAQAGQPPAPWTVPVQTEDPWRPHLDKTDAASAESNERRAAFLGRLARSLKEKSGKDVSLGSVAQTLIDGVYYSGLDLTQADSLDQLKQLLVQSIKPPT
jgi:carbon storage regulator